jgi:O-antigen ligase
MNTFAPYSNNRWRPAYAFAHQTNTNKFFPLERTAQILLCLLALTQYAEHFRFMPFTITWLFGFMLAAVFLLEKRIWKRPDPVFWYLCIISGVFVFSVIWHLNEIPALIQDSANQKVLTLLQSVVLYYFSYCLFAKEQTQRYFLIAIFIGSLIVSSLSIFGIVAAGNYGDRRGFGEMDVNVLASIIGFGIVTAIHFVIKNKSIVIKLIASSGMLLMMWLLVSTGSRGGMLATGVGMVAYFIRLRKVTDWFIGTMVVIILVALALSSEIAFSRWERVYKMGDYANRDVILHESWELFKENPVLGRGDVNASLELGVRLGEPQMGTHNELLWALTSTGLVGGLFVILVVWKVIRKTWNDRVSWRHSISAAYLVLLGIVCMSIEFHDRKIFWIILAFLVRGMVTNDHGRKTGILPSKRIVWHSGIRNKSIRA